MYDEGRIVRRYRLGPVQHVKWLGADRDEQWYQLILELEDTGQGETRFDVATVRFRNVDLAKRPGTLLARWIALELVKHRRGRGGLMDAPDELIERFCNDVDSSTVADESLWHPVR